MRLQDSNTNYSETSAKWLNASGVFPKIWLEEASTFVIYFLKLLFHPQSSISHLGHMLVWLCTHITKASLKTHMYKQEHNITYY